MSYFGYPIYPKTPASQLTESIITGSTTLAAGSATYSKAFMITGAGGYTIALPAIDPVVFATAGFSIFNSSSSACTINVANLTTDTILMLGSSFTSIAIFPGERLNVQNMVTSWTVGIESPSRTTTAPQFDNTIRDASTAFVQRALGNQSGTTTYGANTTLTASDAGKVITASTTGIVFTLPLTSSVPNGTTYSFISSFSNLTISRQGTSDLISGNVPSLTLGAFDTVTLVATSGFWWAIGGSSALSLTASFSYQRTTTGYQKLPSGIILQWGSFLSSGTNNPNAFVNWPIVFPTALIANYAVVNGGTIGAFTAQIFSSNVTGASLSCQNSAAMATGVGGNYLAIGY